mgnify:CR=1 FL=1
MRVVGGCEHDDASNNVALVRHVTVVDSDVDNDGCRKSLTSAPGTQVGPHLRSIGRGFLSVRASAMTAVGVSFDVDIHVRSI